ncbi:TetR/AcrR family transcriptional regulator [Neobacillus sp. MM2021_6]|uniref:TetR/AcrR family transcriptional regulator n=1 Tax=Bacillaceae TaxID=186817 RepID=UPI00140A073E|nr:MULTISPECIES: TetR/AcrR family transcriptional regulator [Bacillaceae]MBO0960553.1 TetR/AcrR family transcriptional regulator [Neobacillus sp. MM2021_6]NHC19259.1 TetR/AcrR family transcriptional regulator [Bacillus sp. MM2020_4]
MYNRKQNVIKMAHQLFIEKGYQATSIQDILDYSGISKGTFYNYFSSKTELLIGIYKSVYKKLNQERNDLLIGQDPANLEIFIKQLEMQMVTNRKNKLIAIYEEVMASNDTELRQFIQRSRLNSLRWLYLRFIDIFGEDKKPFLLDCAVMFQGFLQYNVQYNRQAHKTGEKIGPVVRYCVARLVKMVEEVSESGDQLLEPALLEKWLPTNSNNNHGFKEKLLHLSGTLRKLISKNIPTHDEQEKYLELLEFIQDELLHSNTPRKFIIGSVITSMKDHSYCKKELQQLETLVDEYFRQVDEAEKNPNHID